jgi:hypothetical protein
MTQNMFYVTQNDIYCLPIYMSVLTLHVTIMFFSELLIKFLEYKTSTQVPPLCWQVEAGNVKYIGVQTEIRSQQYGSSSRG